MLHYSKADYGEYYVETGELIGHEADDVSRWLDAHADYRGAITYERWDFDGSIDVTEVFRGEEADDTADTPICIGSRWEAQKRRAA